jgi:hypothetical protein
VLAALEKLSIGWLVENCPPSLLIVIVVAILAGWLSLRVNRLITEALSQESSQTSRIAATEKQQRKAEQLISACPCISKHNATWLQDKSRNGGELPEKIACVYMQAKGRTDQ